MMDMAQIADSCFNFFNKLRGVMTNMATKTRTSILRLASSYGFPVIWVMMFAMMGGAKSPITTKNAERFSISILFTFPIHFDLTYLCMYPSYTLPCKLQLRVCPTDQKYILPAPHSCDTKDEKAVTVRKNKKFSLN